MEKLRHLIYTPIPWFLFIISFQFVQAQVPAFPGAEGFGALATGGRGGDVYHVTTLDDDGEGSLRYGIENASGPRTIVFDISGNIELTSYLNIRSSKMTIAGQTAPGPGLCIQNYGLTVRANNVILRHLRLRPGDKYIGPHDEGGFTEDALTLSADTIIVDHISTSWGVDENLSCGTSFGHISIQYCIIAEGLHKTLYFHGEYTPDHSGHSMGSLIKVRGADAEASMHHNLWAHNNNRNPAIGSYDSTEHLNADIRNNVMYNGGNFGYSSGASQEVDMNYIGNYIIAGPSTSSSNRTRAFDANAPNNLHIYQSGNKIDSDLDALRDGQDTGWGMFDDTWTAHTEEFPMPSLKTHSADQSYDIILSYAGAYFWNRDTVDQRIISDVKNGTGKIIDSQSEVGGYPALPVIVRPAGWDTDQDGMPDAWEDQNGLNREDPGDRNDDPNMNGYTNLEEYLNSLSVVTEIQGSITPDTYGLELLNYPNPFNPDTNILYRIPTRSHVKITLYNSVGQELFDLVDEIKTAGEYTIRLSGKQLASGVYFLKMAAGDEIISKKISLLK
jgi:hypothetical protein